MSPYNNKWSKWSNWIPMIKAKFSNKTKQEILERDVVCIFCWKQGTDVHHVYFWTESEYTKDRNNANKGVLVSRDCHLEIHSCSKWEWKRQEAINYITNL